jgi:hypothetical protein
MRTALVPAALALLVLLALPAFAEAKKAAPEPAAAKAEPKGEPVEISGRVVASMDQVFIKDQQGYTRVEGLDLAPFAGRNIQAKALVIRQDQEYRTVRLLEYRLQSPDDDSPSTGPAKQPARKKK